MLSILGRHERAPDREFEVVFSPFGKSFMAIDGKAKFMLNRPGSVRARVALLSGDGWTPLAVSKVVRVRSPLRSP
jgi:hypothetical protein